MNQQTPLSTSRVQRIRHVLRRRELVVRRTRRLDPHFISVVLGGPDLGGFTSLGFDDHVKLFIPQAAGEPIARDYTPRHHDAVAGELTLEFSLHGPGPASDWARAAKPGDLISVGGPRGSFVVPTDMRQYLLAGDDSALPAIRRRLEELPPTAKVLALLHAPVDIHPLAHAGLELHASASTKELLERATKLNWDPSDAYAWAAGEATWMKQLRECLLSSGWPKDQMRIAAYWKRGAEGHHSTLE